MSRSEALRQRLPLLDARLRRPEVEAIARRLPDEDAFVAGALAWLREGDAEARGLEAAFEGTAVACSAGEGRRALLTWLGRDGAVGWRDRLATRRRLGIDVVRERTAVRVEQVGIREELLLKLLRGRLPVDVPAPAIVLALLTSGRRWPVRKAAAEALVEHARAGGPAGDALPVVLTRARSAQEHPWVRDACDAWIVLVDPGAAPAHVAAGLRPRADPRHFLLRRLRVARAAGTWPEDAARLLAPVLDDPSEHVCIGLAEVLVALGGDPAWRLLDVHARNPSARVRLAVVEHLGRAAARTPAPVLARILGARLAVEDTPLVLRGLARACSRAVAAYAELTNPLREGLDRVVLADVSGDSTEAAAAARRTCARIADPVTHELYTRLHAAVDGIRPGKRASLGWRALGLSTPPTEAQVGSALAELAREDFGLTADVSPAGVTLWRGDRLRFKAWRFLHELLRPAPNKRQGWSHTVGRVISGAVRAPPARMAEVTATTTPGERTVVDRDGSWVPALPTVDDVLHLGAGARIYSAFGVTEVSPPRSPVRRLLNPLRLAFTYPRLARLRSAAIASEEPSERASYVHALDRELGVTIRFQLDQPAPRRISDLSGLLGLLPGWGWVSVTRDAILAPSRASQPALAWFAAGSLALLFAAAARRRESIRAARAAIPLVVGGWGTRGKSGTERIKAGMFHGLGYPVFVKTTGCEAMFICARPGLPAKEVFIFRPHDKSSIWEQADMVEQAAGMGARVMLWECMALRPNLVELLEQDWMTDDLVTLTNAFPDHEDIQGPAGHDIAATISAFVPRRSVAITSEQEFLPLFRERARERGTELEAVEAVEADLWGQDLLDLFPYQEHPRNIALVARVAERLGLDRMLAVATMAEHVVPDLGVLRIYPEVRVAGRVMRFINGMSANERTGCVTNWRRTGCDRIDVDDEPDHAIVIVVNNRADRVARSEVFARIIVQDLSADAFVLIGTNLVGLRGYVATALDTLLRDFQVRPQGATREEGHTRIATWFARLRVGRPSVEGMIAKARAAALGLGRASGDPAALGLALRGVFGGEGLELEAIVAELSGSAALRTAWDAALGPVHSPGGPYEVVATPEAAEAWTGWVLALAKQVMHARVLAGFDAGHLDDKAFRRVFRTLFLGSLRPIDDPATSGDRIITFAARSVMPGSRVTVVGVQNIKGTGLDFAYRWVALGLVHPKLARARLPEPLGRPEALRELLVFDDYGLVDSGTVAAALATPASGEDDEERLLRERVLAHVGGIHDRRRALLAATTPRAWWMKLLDHLERVVDPVDAVRRYWIAHRTMRELRHQTVSLAEAAATMQSLYARQKGGWLVKAVQAGRARALSGPTTR